jgi:nitronate monooxygenase
MTTISPRNRARQFCERFGLDLPILLAPMAGACPPSLSIAVANAGGMGACAALLFKPDAIKDWAASFKAGSNRPAQINLWIPDPPPARDPAREADIARFLGGFGPPVPQGAGDATPPDFGSQCEAVLAERPSLVSSVMGLYPADFVARMKNAGIAWFATVSSVREALAAEAAGADVLVAQGSEAGGHRAAFEAEHAERRAVGLFSLLPAVVDATKIPVVATGGIADGRGVAAALNLGASAAQIGTAFLRSLEARTNPAWADAIGRTLPEDTMLTRAFSGRAGRSIATNYARAASAPDAPAPAPYPVQRGLTAAMREHALAVGDIHGIQAWAGQSAAMARAEPAAEIVARLWREAKELLA